MEKIGFIYLWFDRRRKMYYIGCHWGTPDDGYICSSNRMSDAYKGRPQDFKRRIVQTDITRENLLGEEYKWLSLVSKELLGIKYYNLSIRHFGHWANDPSTLLTVKEKLSIVTKALHNDPIYKEKFMRGRKNMSLPSSETIEKRAAGNRGKYRSEETKEKIRRALVGKSNGPLSAEHKQKISITLTKTNPMHNLEIKQKHYAITQSKEYRDKVSNSMRGKIPKNLETLKRGLWWNNGEINRKCIDCPGDNWNRGRTKNKPKS